MKNVLVTGADGFIGGHLADKLSNLGYNVFRPSYPEFDVTKPRLLKALFKFNFDAVFHLAAQAIVGKAEASARECFNINVMGTVNILETCRKHGVEAVVVASSDKAYGESPPPYREDTPLNPVNPYDTSKAVQDVVTRSYAKTYGLPVTVTRASNVYGPGDLNWSRLIPYTVRCFIKGETTRFHSGRGTIYREWIYVDDVVDAYILLAEKINETRGKAYNVGSGFTATRDDVVTAIGTLLGTVTQTISEEAGFRQIDSQSLDSSRIRALGWRPKVSFEEGLKRTLDWYRDYFKDTLRKP